MPIFGNNAPSIGTGGLSTNDLYGHFDPAFIPAQGNPVGGGDLVSSHVLMAGPPLGEPNSTVQLAVYDTLFMAPTATWLVLAISAPFVVPAATPLQWWVTPIAGVLVLGNSYATAILSTQAGLSPTIGFSQVPNGGASKAWIVPGVFPSPLGVIDFPRPYWLIYTTYERDVSQYSSSVSCCPNGD